MKGLIYIKNFDIECFRWCHVRLINPIKIHPERINKRDRKIAELLDYSDIEFPIKEKPYPLFEQIFNINLNVFYYEKRVYLLYISQQNNELVLNVLLISDGEKSHYVFIKDFNSLMYQKSKHKRRKYFCMHCLQNFTTEEILNKHKLHCLLINGTQKSTYEIGTIKFTNQDKQIPIPFKIYADMECFNKKVNIRKGKSTTFYSKHIPYSVGAKLVCIRDKYTQPNKILFESNCVNEFLQWVFKQKIKCNNIIKNHFNKPIIMTQADEENYNNTNTCWTCTQEISENKVRDHCHITGKFRCTAHKECNLKLKIPQKF